jgi:MATE family multidrug resistance protein
LDGNAPEISSDVNEVVEIASNLILIAAFFQIADGLQAVVLGALRGIQDVIIPAFLIFISYGAIGFPISYYLGLNTEWATYGIWIGLLTGLILSALLVGSQISVSYPKISSLNQYLKWIYQSF